MALNNTQLLALINDLLADNTTQEISEQDIRDVFNAVREIVFPGTGTGNLNLAYDPARTYDATTDGNTRYAEFDNKLWKYIDPTPQSGVTPTEGASWTEVSASAGSGIVEWKVEAVYNEGLIIVAYDNKFYKLLNPMRPFQTFNLDTELLAGDWELFHDIDSSSSIYENVKEYGAVGDGITDDTTAFQDALNTGNRVYAPEGDYIITSSLTTSAAQLFSGSGMDKTILNWTGTGSLFEYENDQSFRDFTILGDGNNNGISSTIKKEFASINNVKFENLANGVNTSNTFTVGPEFIGLVISTCFFINNTNGIVFGQRSEYNTVSDCTINGNTLGVSITGGNNKIIGNTITSNTTGIELLGGTNDGHGIVSENSINHNTTAINCDGVTVGMLISNNSIYVNTSITIANSDRIKIIGNDISLTSIVDGGGVTNLKIIGNEFVIQVIVDESFCTSDILYDNFGLTSDFGNNRVNATNKKILNLSTARDPKTLRYDTGSGNEFLVINKNVGRYSDKFGYFKLTYQLLQTVSGPRGLVNYGATPPSSGAGGPNTWFIFFIATGGFQFRLYDSGDNLRFIQTTGTYNDLNQHTIEMIYDSNTEILTIDIDNGTEVIPWDLSAWSFDRNTTLNDIVRFQLFKNISGVGNGNNSRIDIKELVVEDFKLNTTAFWDVDMLYFNNNEFVTTSNAVLFDDQSNYRNSNQMVSIAVSTDYDALNRNLVVVTTGATDKTITFPLNPTKDDIIEVSKEDSAAGNVIIDGNGKNIINSSFPAGTTTDTIITQGTLRTYHYDGTLWRQK